MVEWLENDEQVRIWKEVVMAYWKHCPNICLDGMKKTLENLSQDSQRPTQYLNQHLSNFWMQVQNFTLHHPA